MPGPAALVPPALPHGARRAARTSPVTARARRTSRDHPRRPSRPARRAWAVTALLVLVTGAAAPSSGTVAGTVTTTVDPVVVTGAMPAGTGAVVPPVPGATVVRRFERPPVRWAPGHRGVDLAAEPGTVLVAPASGRVSFAGRVVDRGVVTLTHDDGTRSSLEPVSALHAVDDHVVAGQPLAVLDTSPLHCGTTSCLHWGVRVGQEYVDPLSLLPGGGPVRLLPWDDGSGAG